MMQEPNEPRLTNEFSGQSEDRQPQQPETIGAPSYLSESEEVPQWFEDIIKALAAGPILIGAILGVLLPLISAAFYCIWILFL